VVIEAVFIVKFPTKEKSLFCAHWFSSDGGSVTGELDKEALARFLTFLNVA